MTHSAARPLSSPRAIVAATRLLVALTAGTTAVLSGSCASEAPPRCENEADATTSDGRIRISTRAPIDVSSSGALSGEAKKGARPMKAVLLLDYSGSMFGGYAKAPVADCPRCKASAKSRGKQPYYFQDPEFRALVSKWIRQAAPAGTDLEISVLLFNKALFDVVPGRTKADGGIVRKIAKLDKVNLKTGREPGAKVITLPAPVRMSEHEGNIDDVLALIPPDPIRFNKRAAQETHLAAAVASAKHLIGDDGLIWLVTDNISDEVGAGCSAADAARNLEFYRLLKEDPQLQSVFAYPMYDGNKCTFMCGTSLFFYGIHASRLERPTVKEVNRLSGNHLGVGDPSAGGVLWNPGLRDLAKEHRGITLTKNPKSLARINAVAGVPLRLKPIDLSVVSVSFKKDDRGRVAPLKCRKTAEFGDKVPCVATLVVRNNLRHQVIKSANLVIENDILVPRGEFDRSDRKRKPRRLSWAGAVCAGDISIRRLRKTGRQQDGKKDEDGKTSIRLEQLLPGDEKEVKLLVVVPSVEIAPTSIGEVFDTAFVDTVYLDGNIHTRVQDIVTKLAIPRPQLHGVYGSAYLPAIFRYRNQSEVLVDFPAIVPVQNDGKLRAILLFAGLALLVLLILARFQRARVTVFVDGVEHAKLSLPRVSRRKIERGASVLGTVRRGVGGRPRFVPRKGLSAKRNGPAWVLSGGGMGDCRVEVRSGWSGSGGGSSRSRGGGGSSF